MLKKIILPLAAIPVAIAALGCCVVLIMTMLCRAGPALAKETLPPRRDIVCMVDTTGSLPASVHDAERLLVVSRILANIGPADFVYCVRLASRPNGEFDEIADVLLVDDRRPEFFNPPRRVITPDDLCPSRWCDRSAPWRANYAKEWARVDSLKVDWARAVEAAKSPEQSCCSNYLKTIQYLAKVVARMPATEQRLLFVLGDLIEERNNRPLLPTAEAEAETERDAFAGVEVHLVCPSGQTDPATARKFQAFWGRYFEERGARVSLHTMGSFAGLPPSGAPRPTMPHPARPNPLSGELRTAGLQI
jgi:hypothetical protein